MSTKIWIISQLECKAQEGNLTDVVITIHWRRNATEVDGDKTYTAEVYSTVSLANPDPAHFTPYNELTQAQVEGWLDASLDVTAIDANLDAQIANQKNPPVVTPPLPWN
jgi:hypothetical protein